MVGGGGVTLKSKKRKVTFIFDFWRFVQIEKGRMGEGMITQDCFSKKKNLQNFFLNSEGIPNLKVL